MLSFLRRHGQCKRDRVCLRMAPLHRGMFGWRGFSGSGQNSAREGEDRNRAKDYRGCGEWKSHRSALGYDHRHGMDPENAAHDQVDPDYPREPPFFREQERGEAKIQGRKEKVLHAQKVSRKENQAQGGRNFKDGFFHVRAFQQIPIFAQDTSVIGQQLAVVYEIKRCQSLTQVKSAHFFGRLEKNSATPAQAWMAKSG